MAKEKGRKLVAQNRKARHDYHIHDTYEAGIVLSGTEVKSLREGRANLADAFATVDDGEVWLRAAHIPEYSHGTWTNHTARRTRKLLLNRSEINKIERELTAAGHHPGAAGPLLLRRVRQGGDRAGHRQTGVRQAADRSPRGSRAVRRSGRWQRGTGARDVHPDSDPPGCCWLSLLAVLATAAGLDLGHGPPRRTRLTDMIDRFDIPYTVQPSGVLEVKETIVWRFGDDSGRHGIER